MRVRAIQAGICRVDGEHIAVRLGEEFDSKDQVVKDFAWMFERVGGSVEQATAAPGEKRNR